MPKEEKGKLEEDMLEEEKLSEDDEKRESRSVEWLEEDE